MLVSYCTSCGAKNEYAGTKPSYCWKCKSSFQEQFEKIVASINKSRDFSGHNQKETDSYSSNHSSYSSSFATVVKEEKDSPITFGGTNVHFSKNPISIHDYKKEVNQTVVEQKENPIPETEINQEMIEPDSNDEPQKTVSSKKDFLKSIIAKAQSKEEATKQKVVKKNLNKRPKHAKKTTV